MSIGYFPEPLPDELFYSALARYNHDIGNNIYRNFSRTFYCNETERADIEFLNHLNSTALQAITGQTPFDTIIHLHTLFDYYTAFVPQERRERALAALQSMNSKQFRNLIPVPHTNQKRYLRFCPLCAQDDRTKYNYTYWHRSVQLTGISICPIHHCRLQNTSILISSKMTPTIISAEELIQNNYPAEMCESQKEIAFAEYYFSVLRLSSSISPKNDTHTFLQSRLVGTPYLSPRKKIRDISLLFNNLKTFCLGTDLPSFKILSQLELLFLGKRYNPAEVCLVGFFLNITPEDILKRHVPKDTLTNTIDDRIKELHKEGWNYAQIAREVGIGYDIVKMIDHGKYGKYQ